LNRALKRQQERESSKTERVYNLTQKQIDEIVNMKMLKNIDVIKKDAQNKLILCITDIVDLALHNKFGFGKKRLKRLEYYVNDIFDRVVNGNEDLDYISDWKKEYLEGI